MGPWTLWRAGLHSPVSKRETVARGTKSTVVTPARVAWLQVIPALFKAVAISGFLGLAPGAAAQERAKGIAVPFAVVATGDWSRIISHREIVIRSEGQWRLLWEEHDVSGGAVPEVDFYTEMVVGVFAGQRPTAGYEVQIVRVEQTQSALIVYYRIRTPPEGALVAQVLTQPFDLVRVRRTDLRVVFKRI